ncbi:MAG: MFS transporter, partial [Prevotella sp.]|nr:MFS transporter [Prevotella sp.]
MSNQNNNSKVIAIIAMMFLFAMVSFVTNMAAPFGNIWGYQYSWAGMMGNMMNFAAYLFMGVPAGRMLATVGYKKTALTAIAVGFIGLGVQYISSITGAGVIIAGRVCLNFVIYLLGAFICGFCVCMLNTVVNPMLNTLGGGGNRGNQYIQIGGSLNSLAATLTPMLAGVLVGTVTERTSMSDIAPLLFIGMGVFLFAFIVISFVRVPEPALERARAEKAKGVKRVRDKYSAWSFRHFVLGAIAIFFYVGIEIGIPNVMNHWLSLPSVKGGIGDFEGAATLAGSLAAIYWLLMLVGRFTSSFISGVVSTRAQMITVSTVAIILIVIAIFMPETTQMSMRIHWGGFLNVDGTFPVKCLFFILCGLCTSVMWGSIFNLCVEGLGKYTEQASGIFMMLVVGGGVMPLIQENLLVPVIGYVGSYWLIVAMLAYLLYYALIGCRNV